MTHPSTWTGDIVGEVYPRFNATQEYRDYEYRATPAQRQAPRNTSTSLLLGAQTPDRPGAKTNASRPLSWFSGSALDLYVHEHDVLWPCATAAGDPLPSPRYDAAKSYEVSAVFTRGKVDVWFACSVTAT